MPDVFSLNDFSQPNAHSCLLWDLLAAPFTPPLLSSLVYLFYLRLHAIHRTRPPNPIDVHPFLQKKGGGTTYKHQSSASLAHFPWVVRPWQNRQVKALLPFLCTKKQLIYVSETGCSGRPSHCICGSFPVKLTQKGRLHCCPVITIMCGIHVGNCNS